VCVCVGGGTGYNVLRYKQAQVRHPGEKLARTNQFSSCWWKANPLPTSSVSLLASPGVAALFDDFLSAPSMCGCTAVMLKMGERSTSRNGCSGGESNPFIAGMMPDVMFTCVGGRWGGWTLATGLSVRAGHSATLG
jgi:hypothetical protein